MRFQIPFQLLLFVVENSSSDRVKESVSILDTQFFERVVTKNLGSSLPEGYKAVNIRSTMVLFSATTQPPPLAALTLKADDLGCLSMLTGRPPPNGASQAYFQGMLNKSDQSFTLTISNLSNEGFINFDVLHSPCEVSRVNPGPEFVINEVNVLSPNQSYTIRADQRNNRRMILGGKIKRSRFPLFSRKQETPMTVKQAEELSTGLNFFLNVVAEKDYQALNDKFSEGTSWKVVPGFVRRVASGRSVNASDTQ